MSVMGLLMKILNDRILRKGDTAIKRLSRDETTHSHHDVIIRTSRDVMAGTVFISFQFVSKTFDDVINWKSGINELKGLISTVSTKWKGGSKSTELPLKNMRFNPFKNWGHYFHHRKLKRAKMINFHVFVSWWFGMIHAAWTRIQILSYRSSTLDWNFCVVLSYSFSLMWSTLYDWFSLKTYP